MRIGRLVNIFFLLFVGMGGHAQNPFGWVYPFQRSGGYAPGYLNPGAKFKQVLSVPNLATLPALPHYWQGDDLTGSIAYLNSDSLFYGFNGTTWRKIGSASITGDSTFFVFNDPLQASQSNDTIYAAIRKAWFDSIYLQTAIISLNGLSNASQVFANGSSGTAPAFISAGSTHTLNIPTANNGGVTAGTISNTQYNTFNNKEPAITPGTTGQYYRWDKTFAALNTDAVTEATNLYFTNAKARAALLLTTTGTNGPATYNSGTGVFNIPNYAIYTDALARLALSLTFTTTGTSGAATGSYNNTTGAFVINVPNYATGGGGGSGINRVGLIDSLTKSTNGAVASNTNLILQTADATYPGLVSTSAQIMGAGVKTFPSNITITPSTYSVPKIYLLDGGAGDRMGFGTGDNPRRQFSAFIPSANYSFFSWSKTGDNPSPQDPNNPMMFLGHYGNSSSPFFQLNVPIGAPLSFITTAGPSLWFKNNGTGKKTGIGNASVNGNRYQINQFIPDTTYSNFFWWATGDDPGSVNPGSTGYLMRIGRWGTSTPTMEINVPVTFSSGITQILMPGTLGVKQYYYDGGAGNRIGVAVSGSGRLQLNQFIPTSAGTGGQYSNFIWTGGGDDPGDVNPPSVMMRLGKWGSSTQTFEVDVPVSIGGLPTNTSNLQFEVQSTTKTSIPFPKMTNTQRIALASVIVGSHVYQTDGTEGVYVYKSTGWQFAY